MVVTDQAVINYVKKFMKYYTDKIRTVFAGRKSGTNGAEIFNDETNIATGSNSHAEGVGTIATSENQHVQGKYNVEDTEGKYCFIIGNGTSDTDRSNALAVDWNGNIYVGNSISGVNISELVSRIEALESVNNTTGE